MRSVRRTLVDSVLTRDQLKWGVEKGGDAAWDSDAAQFPVEKLSNFMDVSSSTTLAHTFRLQIIFHFKQLVLMYSGGGTSFK